jgi:hypothetical protein
MGLGKTILVIAACALLRHLAKAKHIIFGSRSARSNYYADSNLPFFTIVY